MMVKYVDLFDQRWNTFITEFKTDNSTRKKWEFIVNFITIYI